MSYWALACLILSPEDGHPWPLPKGWVAVSLVKWADKSGRRIVVLYGMQMKLVG